MPNVNKTQQDIQNLTKKLEKLQKDNDIEMSFHDITSSKYIPTEVLKKAEKLQKRIKKR